MSECLLGHEKTVSAALLYIAASKTFHLSSQPTALTLILSKLKIDDRFNVIMKLLNYVGKTVRTEDPFHKFINDERNENIKARIYNKSAEPNVQPYQHNRVILGKGVCDPIDPKTFINASIMKYSGDPFKRIYIATQNPDPGTVKDFWTMVYEQNAASVIALISEPSAYLSEESRNLLHSSDFVKKISESKGPYHMGTFRISLSQAPTRDVDVFKYAGWGQNAVPNITEFGKFLQELYQYPRYVPSAPAVIHCTGGAGRTGTFIAVDIINMMIKNDANLYKTLGEGGDVKLLELIIKVSVELRQQRPYSINKEEQLKFILNFLKDLLKVPWIPLEDLKYMPVEKVLPLFNSYSKYLISRYPIISSNKLLIDSKNRYKDILPYSHNQVVLKGDKSKGLDYINASYLHFPGIAQKYIATQEPLETTVNDFWAMIWQQKVGTIVSLAGAKIYYWPKKEEKQKMYGDLTISLVSEKHYPASNLTIRKFTISSRVSVQKVKQYHFTGWPDKSIPKDKQFDAFYELIAQRFNKTASLERPILVHCTAGVGRTGTFIAIDIIYRMLQKDQAPRESLDAVKIRELVYKVAYHLRSQRAYMIQTKEQFEFAMLTVARLFKKWI